MFKNGRYMVIHGGRNDGLMSKQSSVLLNDIHLYDVTLNMWIIVAMYGCLHEGRAMHQIASINDGEELMVFGGTDLKSFISTTQVALISFNHHEIESRLEKFREISRYLEIRSR